MKIHEIIVEQKPTFKLNEVGMAHAEDIIFYEGSAGALRVINSFKTLPKTRETSLTIKWDGQVALYAGRTEDGTFIMTDMSGWTAKGYNGLYTSLKEFLAQKRSKGGNEEFLSKIQQLWPIMESAFPKSYKGFVKGDVMWWPGNLQDNGKSYVFGEGTTKYEIDKTTDLGHRIGQGKAGFAVHGYASTAGTKEEPLKTTAGLNVNGQLCVLGPEIKVEGDVQQDPAKFKQAIAFVKQNAKTIDSFLNIQTLQANKMSSLPDMLYTFVNQQTRIRDLEQLDNKFANWVQSNPKLSKPMVVKVLEYIKTNQAGLQAIFRTFEVITHLKLDIINQLDSNNKGVYAHIDNKAGGEGYVLYDEGGYIKLVNRIHFSATNFGNH
jgi:hypothetical protein